MVRWGPSSASTLTIRSPDLAPYSGGDIPVKVKKIKRVKTLVEVHSRNIDGLDTLQENSE